MKCLVYIEYFRLLYFKELEVFMVFRMMVLEGLAKYEKENGLFPIRWKTHYLVEMFMACLPKIVIDSSSKITITANSPNEFSVNPQKASYYCYDSLGVSVYYLNNLQIDTLYQIEPYKLQETKVDAYRRRKQNEAEGKLSLTLEREQEYILCLIENILIDIVKQVNGDTLTINIIQDTARKLRNMNYYYEKRVDKLCKNSLDRRYRTEIYRCLGKEIGEAWHLKIKTKDDKQYCEWITGIPDYLNRTDFFKKARWEDGTYIINDNLKKPVITINMNAASPVLEGVFVDKRNLLPV